MSSETDQTPQQPSARQTLCAEHRVIKRVLRVLQRLVDKSLSGGKLDVDNLELSVTFFRLFTDACHHAKEEDFLFPVLEDRGIPREGGPIGVMLDEHCQGRRLVGQIAQQLEEYKQGNVAIAVSFRETAINYISLLTMHIYKEDNVLFVMGDRVMGEEDQRGLCRNFCEVGCRNFEGKRQSELEAIADDLERRFP